MDKETGKVKITFLDYLIFALSGTAIFLCAIILAFASILFFAFKLVWRKNFWLISILAAVVFLSAFAAYWFLIPVPWKADRKTVPVLVREGENMHQVVQQLNNAGILPQKEIFILMGKLTGSDRRIHPGRYDFAEGITRSRILGMLSIGDIKYSDVTVPEGLTVKQIAGILKDRIGIDSLEFIHSAKNAKLIDSLGIKAKDLEGYLFPNTYNLYWGISSDEVVKLMLGEFEKIFDEDLRKRAKQIGLGIHKVVALASMIEKETQIDEERPIVSAVFHNRLKSRMLLQCDPTVIYALPDFRKELYTNDLKIDSPYNTYKHLGLPPGPICNPGKKAIIAALYPSKVSYLYFVARGDGSHIFSASLDEHNHARWKIRKEASLKKR